MYYRGCCGLGATLQPGMTPRLPRPSWAPSMPGAMYYRDESAWNYRWMRDFEVLGRESYTLAAEYHPTPNSIVYTFRGKPYAWGEWRADRSFQGEVAPVPRRGALRGYGTSIDTIRLQHPPLARRGSRRFMGYGQEPVAETLTPTTLVLLWTSLTVATEEEAQGLIDAMTQVVMDEGEDTIQATKVVGVEGGFVGTAIVQAQSMSPNDMDRSQFPKMTENPAGVLTVATPEDVKAVTSSKKKWLYWGLGAAGSLLLLGGAFYAGKKSKGR